MPLRVLFLCTGNSAPRHEIHPIAVRVAKEYGLDISHQRPKDVAQFAGQRFDFVITVCDRARESCPVIPGAE